MAVPRLTPTTSASAVSNSAAQPTTAWIPQNASVPTFPTLPPEAPEAAGAAGAGAVGALVPAEAAFFEPPGLIAAPSRAAASADWSSQIATARAGRYAKPVCDSFARSIAPRTADTIAIASHSLHAGHGASSTNWPRENVDQGYLNRNLNTTHPWTVTCVSGSCCT